MEVNKRLNGMLGTGARDVVPCGRCLRGERVHMSRVPTVAGGSGEGGLVRLQPTQMVAHQLRMLGVVGEAARCRGGRHVLQACVLAKQDVRQQLRGGFQGLADSPHETLQVYSPIMHLPFL